MAPGPIRKLFDLASELPLGLRWDLWLNFVAAWTLALLIENPDQAGDNDSLRTGLQIFSKAVHISAYATFAILSGWLRVPGRRRLFLLAAMSFHGCATEFFQ